MTVQTKPSRTCPAWCDSTHAAPPEGFRTCHRRTLLDERSSSGDRLGVAIEHVEGEPATVAVEASASLTPAEAVRLGATILEAARFVTEAGR